MSSTWNESEIKLIEYMKRHEECATHISYKLKGSMEMWLTISRKLNMPMKECRDTWFRIKKRYLELLGRKVKPVRTKYLDGRLSFLNKLRSGSITAPDVVVIDSDEDSKGFFTLDLERIENLLAKRGESQAAMDTARMDDMLSLVSKRIDEALSSYTQPTLLVNTSDKEPVDIKFVPVDNEKTSGAELNYISESQSPQGYETEDDDDDSLDVNLRYAVRAFSNSSQAENRIPIASISIPVMENPKQKEDDMETIFDIHRSSDCETFYQELGRYVKRFSKEKQDEIRLKICCLVTEVELEEVE